MTATSHDLFERLERLGIRHTTHRHKPMFTVADSQQLRGDLPGGHSKNLFLKDKKGALFLVVALEDREIALNKLHNVLNCARLSFGKPDLLREVLGVAPGSVTPFALINDPGHRVSVVLDAGLVAHEVVNFHPLTNDMTTAVAPDDLLAFIRDCGHAPRVLDLGADQGVA